jgi:hypothetical protein
MSEGCGVDKWLVRRVAVSIRFRNFHSVQEKSRNIFIDYLILKKEYENRYKEWFGNALESRSLMRVLLKNGEWYRSESGKFPKF